MALITYFFPACRSTLDSANFSGAKSNIQLPAGRSKVKESEQSERCWRVLADFSVPGLVSSKCCIFPYKMRLQDGTTKVSEAAGARWRFYLRIIFGSCSDHGRIVFILAEAIQGFSADILNSEFRGRRSIWRSWRMTPVALRIVNDVHIWCGSIMIHFAWQAQNLVMLECYFSWQAQHFVKFG